MDAFWWKVMIGTAAIMILVAGFLASLLYYEREKVRHEREKNNITQANERKYRDLFDNVTDLIYLHTTDGIIIDINRILIELLGFRVDQVKGHKIEEFILPRYRKVLTEYLQKAFQGETSIGGFLAIRSITGEKIHILEYLSSTVMSDGSTRAVRGIARDVTDRVRYERLRVRDERKMKTLLENSEEMRMALGNLTREMMMIQERERESISRELHDEISQMIATITMNLETIRSDIPPRKRNLLDRLDKTQDLTSTVLQRIREVLRDLRPLGLGPLGIIPALQMLVRDCKDRSGAEIFLSIDAKIEKLPLEKKIVLYRLVQESLTNAWLHGHAKSVKLSIKCSDSKVYLEICDDGIGFEIDAEGLPVKISKGLGLLGMRERVKIFEGDFSVLSTKGKGTIVRVTLPANQTGTMYNK